MSKQAYRVLLYRIKFSLTFCQRYHVQMVCFSQCSVGKVITVTWRIPQTIQNALTTVCQFVTTTKHLISVIALTYSPCKYSWITDRTKMNFDRLCIKSIFIWQQKYDLEVTRRWFLFSSLSINWKKTYIMYIYVLSKRVQYDLPERKQ